MEKLKNETEESEPIIVLGSRIATDDRKLKVQGLTFDSPTEDMKEIDNIDTAVESAEAD
jgi:hypothetical protein